jgi:hypothetical protein
MICIGGESESTVHESNYGFAKMSMKPNNCDSVDFLASDKIRMFDWSQYGSHSE